MKAFRQLRDEFLGPLNLSVRLADLFTRRMILINALPGLIVVASIMRIAIVYYYDLQTLFYFPGEGDAPEFWVRTARLTSFVQYASPVAVGVLFLAGLRDWTRSQGGWMLVIGAILAGIGLILISLSATLVTVTDDLELIIDLRLFDWADIASRFGLLSIGYFFVAYRGLSTTQRRPPVRRRTRLPAAEPDVEEEIE